MRYEHRDDTFRIDRTAPDEPEFLVKVSPVANGWWTRNELTRLHDKIGQALEKSADGKE